MFELEIEIFIVVQSIKQQNRYIFIWNILQIFTWVAERSHITLFIPAVTDGKNNPLLVI